ncbi:phage terminase large subunit [Acinetobacter sp. ANC 3832]|uniref:phage terminase large subunit n=1 Tax=Acinetobacter sp. ANC 3832 TaxID=1977874 RepID=UPI000A3373C8|nr:phage terminase large subunit [Acinetobacter sp. ANC 3832]OTG87222.1 terminase [Acinetobacter sp. ANC 3832]
MSTEAERDLAIQIEAQEDLYFFSRYMFKERRKFKWLANWHHRVVCDALMKVFSGETKRLIINIPPRYSKTELAVINFMAWCFGKVPDSEFIHVSYSATLAANNAFQTRNLVQEDSYKKVFPDLKLRDDSKAKDDWRTADGGVCYSQGTGGTITGFGAGKLRDGFGGAIIIDDPHKASEARSDTIRKNVIEWFQNTLESRTNSPNTPIIVIMQRLHEEDLAGWLLDGGNGEVWEHLELSAIQPDGTALWPAKHTIEVLNRMELAAPYVFSGQYRQRPSPPAGGFFKPDNIEIVDAIPAEILKEVRAWDLASSENEGDWTAGPRMLKAKDNIIYIVDMVRGQWGPDGVERNIKQTAQMDGRKVVIKLPQDPGQAGKAQAKNFITMLSGFSVTAEVVSGDKITRAEPFAAQVNVGNVKMLRGDWNKALIDELRNFPNAKHDDQVDGCSDGFNELLGSRVKAKPATAGSRTY